MSAAALLEAAPPMLLLRAEFGALLEAPADVRRRPEPPAACAERISWLPPRADTGSEWLRAERGGAEGVRSASSSALSMPPRGVASGSTGAVPILKDSDPTVLLNPPPVPCRGGQVPATDSLCCRASEKAAAAACGRGCLAPAPPLPAPSSFCGSSGTADAAGPAAACCR